MKSGKLLLANFDARIPKIDIKPKSKHSKVIIFSNMYDETEQKRIKVKIQFDDVAVIDFRINYFDNMIGAEAFGLYEIQDSAFIESVLKGNFEQRREIYLLEGDYDYDEEDSADLLNVFDLSGTYKSEKEDYHAFVQNVDAGIYIVIAKEYQIIR